MRAHTFEPPRRAGLRSGFLTTKLPSAEIDHSPRTAPALAAAARHARQEGKHPAVEADSPAKKLPSSSSVIAAEAYQLPIAPPWASQMETPPQPTSAQPTLAQPPPQSRIFEMPNLCDARTLKVADEHESGQKNCVVGIGSAACALLLSSPPIVEACPMPISVAALDNDDDISLCKRVDQILNTAKADWSLASNFEERWPTWHRAALCLWGLSSTEKTELLRAVEELEDVDHDPTRERFRYAFPVSACTAHICLRPRVLPSLPSSADPPTIARPPLLHPRRLSKRPSGPTCATSKTSQKCSRCCSSRGRSHRRSSRSTCSAPSSASSS